LKLQLTIVTQNQQSIEEAQELGKLLLNELGENTIIQSIEPYSKFESAFAINLEKILPDSNTATIIHQCIALADEIVSPWLTYYDNDLEKIELIYNHSEQTQTRKNTFNQIKWAQIIY
jgi:hypothetical protein